MEVDETIKDEDAHSEEEAEDKSSSTSEEEEEETGDLKLEFDPHSQEENKENIKQMKKRQLEQEKIARNMLKEQNQKEYDESMASRSRDRLKFLLNQTQSFAQYLINRNTTKGTTPGKGAAHGARRRERKISNDEDELMNMEMDENAQNLGVRISEQPTILKGGQLRDYQLIGLNWLVNLFESGINGILADEMGLGKTIQTISLLAYMREFKNIKGHHIVIVPKSTMWNWMNEFAKWAPCMRVVLLEARKEAREATLSNYIIPGKFDVVITSYEGVAKCSSVLRKFYWKYLIIDEAHRIKNENSVLSKLVRSLNTYNRLLITGTPLQNNLHELWALLNFLLPDIFNSSDDFDSWFELGTNNSNNPEEASGEDKEKKNMQIIQQLHKILQPFLLRRTKREVETSLAPKKEIHVSIGLTEIQKRIYRDLLKKTFSTEASKTQYHNILMQLRKACNHPYLFDGIEDTTALPEYGDHIITVCGKMQILDKLLVKLKEQGSQVLIFSQMTSVLDILEDYCFLRHFTYCRIDGNTDLAVRNDQINDFVSPDTDKFIFLLSTRAGGLGINLASADTVILYDSDWNPQVDLQAIDRAHRIGQKKQVMVYRFITDSTIEEKIIERQYLKLKLDNVVIQQTGKQLKGNSGFTKDQLQGILHYGADEIFKTGDSIKDEDIDKLLERGEKRAQALSNDIQKHVNNRLNLADFSINAIDVYNFDNQDYNKKRKEEAERAITVALAEEMESDFRTRKERRAGGTNYNIDDAFKGLLSTKTERKVKPVKLPDFHFYSDREKLQDLLTKEAEYLHIKGKTKPSKTEEGEDAEKVEKTEEERELEENNGLTVEEKTEKDEILATGHVHWDKKEYLSFVSTVENHGRSDFKKLIENLPSKSEEEIKEYSKVFWEHVEDLTDHQKIIRNVEKTEKTIEYRNQCVKYLDKKCKMYENPWEDLAVPYHLSKTKNPQYTEENDRYLICAVNDLGYGSWNQLRLKIRKDPRWNFDYLLNVRTSDELKRRVDSLVKLLEKELTLLEEKERERQEKQKKRKNAEIKKKTAKDEGSPKTSSKKRSRPENDKTNSNKSKKLKTSKHVSDSTTVDLDKSSSKRSKQASMSQFLTKKAAA
eukprot:CAMPEP_0115046438 /NCGR_PEP_ID=MMETSP0216-20121206/48748_1 /TAXON_ID=223996 /ORGANISM="Protocruzia adherens, Strain Boccale" /LENGTH=1110 /DNA_ID=CAMNT_0002429517 /DNA_START=236 /DNA_END=3568 /DNA_ORIENTATION=+